ncbi:MAG: hypothetical protein MZV64_02285 [Ignavibacteriales bacterium]|nr:hypothetical protein [Ignavibacteriales bacterium]
MFQGFGQAFLVEAGRGCPPRQWETGSRHPSAATKAEGDCMWSRTAASTVSRNCCKSLWVSRRSSKF